LHSPDFFPPISSYVQFFGKNFLEKEKIDEMYTFLYYVLPQIKMTPKGQDASNRK
jgi:hypothetical protein